jgi:ATP-dependent DNA helicase RecG
MEKNGSPPPKFSTDEGRTYFLVELPVHPQLPGVQGHDGVQDGVHVELSETEQRILNVVNDGPRKSSEIAAELGYSTRTRNVRSALKKLLEGGLLELTVPDKPNSRNQKMRITDKGRAWLATQLES